MKNFILGLLIVVAVCELAALGIIYYQKNMGVVLAFSFENENNKTPSVTFTPNPTSTPSTTADSTHLDYLALVKNAENVEITPIPLELIATSTATPVKLLSKKSPTPKVLAAVSKTPTPTVKISVNPTPSPSKTPTTSPTIITTLTPTPTASVPVSIPKYSSAEINSFIDRFAGQYGVDANVLRHIALCESGFNPAAKYLIYGGLYQFSPTTWASWRRKMGEDTNSDLRFNAEEAVQTAAYVISKGSIGIWPNCKP